MYSIFRQRRFTRRLIALVVASVFFINDFSWAIDIRSAPRYTLAIPSQLTENSFKERFLAREFALSAEGADRYISEQIDLERDIIRESKGSWEDERTKAINVRGYVSRDGKIRNNVPGLDTIKLIKVTGVLPKTGQFAKVDLTGKYDPLPVMKIDSSFYNWFDNALQKHEIEEIIQWEDLRVNILGISGLANMEAWQDKNIDELSADAREKLSGTIYKSCNSSRDIAHLIHSRSHSLDQLYAYKAKQLGEMGVRAAFDFEKLSALFNFYNTGKPKKLNIAAAGSVSLGATSRDSGGSAEDLPENGVNLKGDTLQAQTGVVTTKVSPNRITPLGMAPQAISPDLGFEVLERLIKETRDAVGLRGDCILHATELARRVTENGIGARVIWDGKHNWVEETRADGYVLDTALNHRAEAIREKLGGGTYFIGKKGSTLAQEFYRGKPRKRLTTLARRNAKDPKFYQKFVITLETALNQMQQYHVPLGLTKRAILAGYRRAIRQAYAAHGRKLTRAEMKARDLAPENYVAGSVSFGATSPARDGSTARPSDSITGAMAESDIKYEKTNLPDAIQNARKCADQLVKLFDLCDQLSRVKLYLRAAEDLPRFRKRTYKKGDAIDLEVGLNVWLYPNIGYAFESIREQLGIIAHKLRTHGQDVFLNIEAIEDEYKKASEHMFVLEDFARGTFMEESVTAVLKYKCTPKSRVPYPSPSLLLYILNATFNPKFRKNNHGKEKFEAFQGGVSRIKTLLAVLGLYIKDIKAGDRSQDKSARLAGVSMPEAALAILGVAAAVMLTYCFGPVILEWTISWIIKHAFSLPSFWQKATGILAIAIAAAYFAVKKKGVEPSEKVAEKIAAHAAAYGIDVNAKEAAVYIKTSAVFFSVNRIIDLGVRFGLMSLAIVFGHPALFYAAVLGWVFFGGIVRSVSVYLMSSRNPGNASAYRKLGWFSWMPLFGSWAPVILLSPSIKVAARWLIVDPIAKIASKNRGIDTADTKQPDSVPDAAKPSSRIHGAMSESETPVLAEKDRNNETADNLSYSFLNNEESDRAVNTFRIIRAPEILAEGGMLDCVGLVIFDPLNKIGAVAHVNLSNLIMATNDENAADLAAFKGVDFIVQRLRECGADEKQLQAAVIVTENIAAMEKIAAEMSGEESFASMIISFLETASALTSGILQNVLHEAMIPVREIKMPGLFVEFNSGSGEICTSEKDPFLEHEQAPRIRAVFNQVLSDADVSPAEIPATPDRGEEWVIRKNKGDETPAEGSVSFGATTKAPDAAKPSSRIHGAMSETEDTKKYGNGKWRKVFSELVLKPVGFNWQKEVAALPDCDGLYLAKTNVNGAIIFTPISHFQFIWKILGFREADWEAYVTDSSVKNGIFQFTVKLTKNKKKPLLRTFQIGPGVRTLRGVDGKKGAVATTLDINDKAGAVALGALLADPDRFKSDVGASGIQTRLRRLIGLRLGQTNVNGDIGLTPFPYYYFYWAALGYKDGGWDAVITDSDIHLGIPQITVRFSKDGADPFTKTYQIGPYTRAVPGRGKEKDKVVNVMNIDEAPGLRTLSEFITAPRKVSWKEYSEGVPLMRGLHLGETTKGGYIEFSPFPYYRFRWYLLGFPEAGWQAVITDSSIESGYYRFVVRFTKDGKIPISRMFQIGPYRRTIISRKGNRAEIHSILSIQKIVQLAGLEDYRMSNGPVDGQDGRLTVESREERPGSSMDLQQIIAKIGVILNSMSEEDRNIATRIIDEMDDESAAAECACSVERVRGVKEVLQDRLRVFAEELSILNSGAIPERGISQVRPEPASDSVSPDRITPNTTRQAFPELPSMVKQIEKQPVSIAGGVKQRLAELRKEAPAAAVIKKMAGFYEYETLSIRRMVFNYIVSYGREAIDGLIESLRNENNPAILAGAIITLGYLARRAEKEDQGRLTFLIRPYLESADTEVSKAALEALRYIASERAREAMLTAFNKNTDMTKEFFMILELASTLNSDMAVPILKKIKESSGISEIRAGDIKMPFISLLLNPWWLARHIEAAETELASDGISRNEYIELARRYGYMDDHVADILLTGKKADDLTLALQILRGGVGIVTKRIFDKYKAREPAKRDSLLSEWKARISEFSWCLIGDTLLEKRGIVPLDTEERLDADLLFASLRQADYGNIISKTEPMPFEHRHQNQQLPERFSYVTEAGFGNILKRAHSAAARILAEKPCSDTLKKVLLPFMITDYLTLSCETRDEEYTEEELKFFARWKTIAKIVEIKAGSLAIRDNYYALIKKEINIAKECAMSDKENLAAFISTLADTKSHNIWKFCILDPEIVGKANRLIDKFRISQAWFEISFGAQSALRLYAYDLFSDPGTSEHDAEARWVAEMEGLRKEEAEAKNTLPSEGIEIQSVSASPEESYALKRALEHFGIPSPRRLEFGATVEAAFMPCRSTRAYLLSIPILEKVGLFKEYRRASALHISVEGDLGPDAKYIALALRSFNLEKHVEKYDGEHYKLLTRLMSKGFMYRNNESQPVAGKEEKPEVHTEIRTSRLENISPEENRLNPFYIDTITGVQYLAAALQAARGKQPQGASDTVTSELEAIWSDFKSEMDGLYRNEKYHMEKLLDFDWFEATGDPRDPELVKKLKIITYMDEIRDYHHAHPDVSVFLAELRGKTMDIFMKYASKARDKCANFGDSQGSAEKYEDGRIKTVKDGPGNIWEEYHYGDKTDRVRLRNIKTGLFNIEIILPAGKADSKRCVISVEGKEAGWLDYSFSGHSVGTIFIKDRDKGVGETLINWAAGRAKRARGKFKISHIQSPVISHIARKIIKDPDPGRRVDPMNTSYRVMRGDYDFFKEADSYELGAFTVSSGEINTKPFAYSMPNYLLPVIRDGKVNVLDRETGKQADVILLYKHSAEDMQGEPSPIVPLLREDGTIERPFEERPPRSDGTGFGSGDAMWRDMQDADSARANAGIARRMLESHSNFTGRELDELKLNERKWASKDMPIDDVLSLRTALSNLGLKSLVARYEEWIASGMPSSVRHEKLFRKARDYFKKDALGAPAIIIMANEAGKSEVWDGAGRILAAAARGDRSIKVIYGSAPETLDLRLEQTGDFCPPFGLVPINADSTIEALGLGRREDNLSLKRLYDIGFHIIKDDIFIIGTNTAEKIPVVLMEKPSIDVTASGKVVLCNDKEAIAGFRYGPLAYNEASGVTYIYYLTVDRPYRYNNAGERTGRMAGARLMQAATEIGLRNSNSDIAFFLKSHNDPDVINFYSRFERFGLKRKPRANGDIDWLLDKADAEKFISSIENWIAGEEATKNGATLKGDTDNPSSRIKGAMAEPEKPKAAEPGKQILAPIVDRYFKVEVLPDESYPVMLTRGVFALANKTLAQQIENKKTLFIIDSGVAPHVEQKIKLYAEKHNIDADIFIAPGGEESKEGLRYVSKVIEKAEEFGIDRKQMIVIVGGGAVTDMGGFTASILHRGVEHIRVPTTLLSQIDAAVGSKNAVNFLEQKNMVGVFQPPKCVIVDPELLGTLDERQMRSGLAEAIKVAIMKDGKFFKLLEEHFQDVLNKDFSAESRAEEIMWATIILHLEQIKTDPYEKKLARPLDFGHEWGHRLESVTHYRLTHGEGVAIGMAVDSVISYNRGYITERDLNRVLNLIESSGLPIFDQEETIENIWPGLESFRRHLGGELTIPLIYKEIGRVKDVHEISEQEVISAIEYLRNRAAGNSDAGTLLESALDLSPESTSSAPDAAKPSAHIQGAMAESTVGSVSLGATTPASAAAGEAEKTDTGPVFSTPKLASEKIIVIGASAYGWRALKELIKNLPYDHPPVVVSQHLYIPILSQGYGEDYEEFLEFVQQSQSNIILCKEGYQGKHEEVHLKKGMVLIGNVFIMEKDANGGPLARAYGPQVNMALKNGVSSVNALFTSAAEHFGENVISVILSGVGEDGLLGAREIYDNNGIVLAQKITGNESSYYLSGMPEAVIKSDIPCQAIGIEDMASQIMKHAEAEPTPKPSVHIQGAMAEPETPKVGSVSSGAARQVQAASADLSAEVEGVSTSAKADAKKTEIPWGLGAKTLMQLLPYFPDDILLHCTRKEKLESIDLDKEGFWADSLRVTFQQIKGCRSEEDLAVKAVSLYKLLRSQARTCLMWSTYPGSKGYRPGWHISFLIAEDNNPLVNWNQKLDLSMHYKMNIGKGGSATQSLLAQVDYGYVEKDFNIGQLNYDTGDPKIDEIAQQIVNAVVRVAQQKKEVGEDKGDEMPAEGPSDEAAVEMGLPANVADALRVLDGIAAKNLDDGQVYEIRYDMRRLAESGYDDENSALVALKTYAVALRMRAGKKWRDKIRLIEFNGESDSNGRLISVKRYAGLGESRPIGTSQIDVSESISKKPIDVVMMLNMAIIACEIPEDVSAEDARRDHRGILERIEVLYNTLSDTPFDMNNPVFRLIGLTLPSASKLSTDALRDYYRLTIEALRKYA